ncbi:MAG: hypothetical protein LUI13_09130 [Lachnospiraceae bacterium]|nr:hypothetical protein [Lachnospiraceae bacterium]
MGRKKAGKITQERAGYGKIGCLLACIFALLLSSVFGMRTTAMETGIDTEAAGTLTVSYRYGTDSDADKNLPLPGAVFRIYRVAAYDANGVLSLTPEFQACGVTNEQLNSMEHAQDWNARIETLVQYIGTAGTESGTSVYQSAKTDENGAAVFSNLKTGLYLLTVDDLTLGQTSYAGSPALVSVPSANEEGTAWEYEVAVSVKPEATTETESENEPETSAKATEPAKTTEASTEPEESAETAAEGASDETEAETTESPQTGDDALLGVWLAVMLGAFGALILAAAWEIRRGGTRL